jgi:hypothetical protein
MRRSWTPSIVPNGRDQTVYLVLNDFGRLGRAYCETSDEQCDLETIITDLISGQYDNPVQSSPSTPPSVGPRMLRKTSRGRFCARLDRAGGELSPSLEAFVEQHLGSERHLTLR